MAVRNSGGLVIVQVERIAERGSLNPRQSRFPASWWTAWAVAQPEHHWQTFAVQYDPAFSGDPRLRRPARPDGLERAKIIARRARSS